jgi:hypothetical protein
VPTATSGWAEAWTSWCGDFRVRYAYRWHFVQTPVITVQPTPNTSLCLGSSTTLSVTTDTDAFSGIPLGQNFKWQVSNFTDCAGAPASSWVDIPGSNSPTFTPPQISGTRLYRVVVTSNCTADFGSFYGNF